MIQPAILTVDESTELRPLTEGDAKVIYTLIDKNRDSLREWLPWVDNQKSAEDTLAFIRRSSEKQARSESLTFGVWSGSEIVGVISFRWIEWENRTADIGYWLSPHAQGKGVMLKAVRALIQFGLSTLELHRIEVRCAEGNSRSCTIPEKLGFTREGLEREGQLLHGKYVNVIVYSLLSGEWIPK